MTNCVLGLRRLLIGQRYACLGTLLVLGCCAMGCQSMPSIRGQSPEITRPIGVESNESSAKDSIEDILVEGNNTIDTGAVLAPESSSICAASALRWQRSRSSSALAARVECLKRR